MSQVCRTCLEVVQNASQLFSLEINEPPHDTVHIKTKLETCVPELALHRVKNSVICIYCVGALNTAYNFKTKCLQTEMRLSEYMTKETTDSVDLKKFVEGNTKSPKNHTPLTNTKDINIISLLTDNSSNQLQPNEIYVCHICQKSLASNSLLKEHMSCHNEGGFKCSFCDYHSALEFELQEHLKSHNGLGTESPQNEPPYKCSSCDFITMDKTLFKEHKVLHSGERLYPCNLCNFKTTHSSSLRRHMKIHTGMRPFRCTKCRYGAPDMEALKMHMRTHTGDKPHKCPECLYSASKRIHLKNHMARAHADKLLNPFSSTNGHAESDEVQCASSADPYQVSIDDINNILKDDCDLSNDPPEVIEDNEVDGDPYMVTIADIQEILQGKLPAPSLNEADRNEAVIENEEFVGPGMVNQPVFRCPVCQQPFKFKYLLKKHMSVHARENKPYECTECGYSTLTKSHFQVHMNTHTGGKIYKCEQCPYSTVYWSNMQKHSRVHTGEKPFKCPYCDYKATQQTSVNSHMNIHPEHRPYPCNECPYAADTMVALQKHMEMHAIGNHFMEEDDVILVVPEEATA